MIREICTVFWKEWREGKRWTDKLVLFLFAVLIGCGIPAVFGRVWFESGVPIYFWMIISIIMVMTSVADTFAGERERHTLETLLSENLSEKSVALGKMMSVLVLGWGYTLSAILLSSLTVNYFYFESGWIFPYNSLYSAGLSFMTAFLFTILGSWFSMNLPTVIKAQRWVFISFIVFIFIVFFVIPERLSHWEKERVEWVILFKQLPDWEYYLIWMGMLLIIDLHFLVLSLWVCNRKRLLRV